MNCLVQELQTVWRLICKGQEVLELELEQGDVLAYGPLKDVIKVMSQRSEIPTHLSPQHFGILTWPATFSR